MSEIVVVGGGPAGSATALLLARAGRDVRIVERAAFPRRKACGEYLNGGAVAALGRLGVLERVRAAASPLRGVRLAVPGEEPVALAFDAPALACARERLDAVLLDAAREAGAQVERGRVEDAILEGGVCRGVRVRGDDGALAERRASFVVGADGAGSIVARKLGLLARAPRGARFAVGGHYAGLGALDGHVEMAVERGAYFAVNPLGDALANVMAVVPRDRVAAWSAGLDAKVGATRVGPRIAIGPLAHAVRRPIARGALLVGDAAGFLDPFTGQGIFLALAGAERAAAAILAEQLDAYAAWRLADAARRARLCAAVKLLVETPLLARRAARRLRRDPRLAATLVALLAGTAPPRRFAAVSLAALLA